jgi:hypothetical protein
MTTSSLSKEELDRRNAIVEYAVATVGLENLRPDLTTLSAAMRWASGQISLPELMEGWGRPEPSCISHL